MIYTNCCIILLGVCEQQEAAELDHPLHTPGQGCLQSGHCGQRQRRDYPWSDFSQMELPYTETRKAQRHHYKDIHWAPLESSAAHHTAGTLPLGKTVKILLSHLSKYCKDGRKALSFLHILPLFCSSSLLPGRVHRRSSGDDSHKLQTKATRPLSVSSFQTPDDFRWS